MDMNLELNLRQQTEFKKAREIQIDYGLVTYLKSRGVTLQQFEQAIRFTRSHLTFEAILSCEIEEIKLEWGAESKEAIGVCFVIESYLQNVHFAKVDNTFLTMYWFKPFVSSFKGNSHKLLWWERKDLQNRFNFLSAILAAISTRKEERK